MLFLWVSKVKALLAGVVLVVGVFASAATMAADFWGVETGQEVLDTRMNITLNPSSFTMSAGGETVIVLPGGQRLSAKLSRVESHKLGGQSWIGTVGSGPKSGRVLLTEVSGFAFGEVVYDNQQYLIEPRQDGAGHVIYKSNDPSRIEVDLVSDGVIAPPPVRSSAKTETVSKPAAVGSVGTLDVGIFYHDSMIDRWGLGLAARLQFLVSLLDTALVDSQTDVRANLVHMERRIGTIDGKSNGDTLGDFRDNVTNADGNFSGIEAIRTAKGLDVVTYIRRFKASVHNSCGTGYVLGVDHGNLNGFAASSYNTVSDDVDIDAPANGLTFLCSIYTLTHEVGHNMGIQHDIATTPGNGVFSFSHGYRVDGKFRTIMGTNSSTGETRIGMFSNPSISTCKDPASADPEEACGNATADAARSIRQGGYTMQDFRPRVPRLVSAVLPSSRSIGNASSGGVATAFATVINPAGSGTATNCGLILPGATGGQFSYQTTTAANVLSGTANTPVSIPDGAAQSFVFAITPGAAFTEADIPIDFFCSNRASAEITNGLNTLFFSAVDGATPDIVAIAGTDPSTPGIVETAPGGSGAFVVAVSNVGAAGTVTFSGEASSASVPATVTVCQTVPATGACMATPSADVDATLGAGDTATFAVFVTETANIVFDPANARIFGRFRDGSSIKGSTSVAVRTDTTP